MKKHGALLAIVAGGLLLGAAPGARAGSWAFDRNRDRDARHHHREEVRAAERHRAIVRAEEAREAERRREIARAEEARRERDRHWRTDRRRGRHDHNPLGYIGAADRDRHR